MYAVRWCIQIVVTQLQAWRVAGCNEISNLLGGILRRGMISDD